MEYAESIGISKGIGFSIGIRIGMGIELLLLCIEPCKKFSVVVGG